MNKGLEVIEAHWLFDLPYDRIEVLVHPQGIVHSLVQFQDGSLKAQLGTPDMRTPIRYALSWPRRWPSALPELDLLRSGSLHFYPPDLERFPCLGFARWAGKEGGTYPTALCAADEVAVGAFLAGRLSWSGISHLVRSVLDRHQSVEHPSLDDVLAADQDATRVAQELLGALTTGAVR
jgi:1-deoxy-D-xylulose-5-phosphate reductoisomerase